MAAPPTHAVSHLHIVSNTAVERRSRAPWQDALPPSAPSVRKGLGAEHGGVKGPCFIAGCTTTVDLVYAI